MALATVAYPMPERTLYLMLLPEADAIGIVFLFISSKNKKNIL